jgi:hypothetical protein
VQADYHSDLGFIRLSPVKIVFELDDDDVLRFREALAKAHAAVRCAEESDILFAAKQALNELPLGSAPGFVRRRLNDVQRLIIMLEDEAWALPVELREQVLPALAYFCDPEDLIPDHLHGIGLFDDAIMLELLLIEERPLLEAYAGFCCFRAGLTRGDDQPEHRVSNARLLAQKRAELMAELRLADPLVAIVTAGS